MWQVGLTQDCCMALGDVKSKKQAQENVHGAGPLS